MPPRRRTFYLADATVLSNTKVRRLARTHPDRWLAAWGAFHLLIGVATLNGSPKLTDADVLDTIGPEHDDLLGLLRGAGLLTRTGIDRQTFLEWCPKPRPRYPSDDKPPKNSNGIESDSDGVDPDSAGVGHDSEGTPSESPTSTTSTTSASATGAASPSRGAGQPLRVVEKNDRPKSPQEERRRLAAELAERYRRNEITDTEYARLRRDLGLAS